MPNNEPNCATDPFWRDRQAAYAQLIGDSVPDLVPATCFYFDGLGSRDVLLGIIALAERWFLQFEKKPKVLLTSGDKSVLSPRYTVRTLKEAAKDAEILGAIDSLQIFPKGRTTIEDTWFPSIYFALRLNRPASAFFCINEELPYDTIKSMMIEGQRITGSCASYTFSFPQQYSPLGYFWGISVQPSGPHVGKWGASESRRLSHWRDNSDIGIPCGESRRWYSVRDGYVRDTYPLMLLTSTHFDRKLGRTSLRETIVKEGLGSLSSEGGMFLWCIDHSQHNVARQLLEQHKISLSGCRFTSPSS